MNKKAYLNLTHPMLLHNVLMICDQSERASTYNQYKTKKHNRNKLLAIATQPALQKIQRKSRIVVTT